MTRLTASTAGHRAVPRVKPVRRPWRLLFAALVLPVLIASLLGGLLRAGVAVPLPAGAAWAGHAVMAHAALMMAGFFGTLIALERAVALKWPPAYAGPVASAGGALLILAGHAEAGRLAMLGAALLFCVASAMILRRQRAAHTALLLVAAVAWAVGSGLQAWRPESAAPLPWWFAFLLLTIAAERLEMTRLTRRHPAALPAFVAIVGTLLAGAAANGVFFGAALVGLALWLFAFDIARHTVRSSGLPRYMAICLLSGYGWLAVGGVTWIAWSLGMPSRDAALHALGLGFVFSMVMGHAPVILPALARVKLRFGPWFYLPLAALHGTLAWRLVAGWGDTASRAQGALGNALAIALFFLTVLGAIAAWRFTSASRS
ncbi:hypothetical protein [Ideonella sp. YS5]|uniref:hypothetical protein n=1 Tax=Ideonella sp. YS5 TaxID=3453714 RepID=UPI003EE8F995